MTLAEMFRAEMVYRRAYCPYIIYTVNKGFAIDWCAFRLLVLDQKTSSEDTTAIYKELGHFFTTEDPTGLAIKTLINDFLNLQLNNFIFCFAYFFPQIHRIIIFIQTRIFLALRVWEAFGAS